jgi:alpha-beta hydrolase superfamily lysophospholipase
VHGRVTLRCWRELQSAMRHARANAAAIRTPVLMLCGEADRVVSTDAARAMFASLACEKRWQSYPGMYHELHHEPVKEAVLHEITAWLAPV